MRRQSLGLIGVGAFGALAAKHLAPHVDLVLHDVADVTALAKNLGVRIGTLSEAASCEIVVPAVPVQMFRDTLISIAPLLRPDALVVDVCSVKMKPVSAMIELLPKTVAIIGTHPLFGPQSGKNGIKDLNLAVCDVRGGRASCLVDFCRQKLGLRVTQVTPEEHDREAAYVQGLTHMLAKIIAGLDLPEMRFPTRTYELMTEAVEMVRYDSEDLFCAIERENPFATEAKKSFFDAARRLEEKLI